jgi:Dolichyl-phosphate-mannose-protein mannosyltransferase
VQPSATLVAGSTQPDPPQPDADLLRKGQRFAHLPGVCLIVSILTVQAALSVSLSAGSTAFGNEAQSLWIGRLVWAHWLHGVRIPDFATWFSGSPVCYPPIAALADDIGGLAGARILSLCLMLGATCLLWGTTSRLFGRRQAYFAAALFAVISPTIRLGGLATCDALALFLIALAAFCACGARTRQDSTGWILACTGALALANATMYATMVLDPVVIVMAVLCACPEPGGKAALRRGSLLVTTLTGALALLLKLGGAWYVTGVRQAVLPPSGLAAVLGALADTWNWTAVVLLAALTGLALTLIRKAARPVSWLIATLAAAMLLVPLDQAGIQTAASLNKSLDLGAWFACIAAGYALGFIVTWLRPRPARLAVTVCVAAGIVPVATAGTSQAESMVRWPSEGRLIAFLRPLTAHGGRFLAETADVPDSYLQYYLPATSWRQWSSTFSITMPNGRILSADGSPAPYRRAIATHSFALVILSFSATPRIDQAITRALKAASGYKYIGSVPYTGPVPGNYVIWQYRPSGTPGGP